MFISSSISSLKNVKTQNDTKRKNTIICLSTRLVLAYSQVTYYIYNETTVCYASQSRTIVVFIPEKPYQFSWVTSLRKYIYLSANYTTKQDVSPFFDVLVQEL